MYQSGQQLNGNKNSLQPPMKALIGKKTNQSIAYLGRGKNYEESDAPDTRESPLPGAGVAVAETCTDGGQYSGSMGESMWEMAFQRIHGGVEAAAMQGRVRDARSPNIELQ
jgi:hypothetical protein